jgi:hypothetical protein
MFDFTLLIPIVGTIFGIALVMLIIYLDHRRKTDTLRHAHEERMAAIQRGIELPPPSPTLPAGQTPADRVFAVGGALHGQRTFGFLALLVGAAIMVAMWETGSRYGWWGLVPAAVGVANLVGAQLGYREYRASLGRGAPKGEPAGNAGNEEGPGT